MSSKQNLDFYLPSLINNHKFQQIFYHHNKLILYDTSSHHTALTSPKAIQILERPKTSVSISVSQKLSTRLVQARSKASIDKFISMHKRIQEEKQKQRAQNACFFPKKKYNRMLVKRTQVSKLETIVTEDQSIKRDQTILTEIPKESLINTLITNASTKNIQTLEPQDKLMKEITEKVNNTFERKSVRLSTKQINSVDRQQSRKSIHAKAAEQNNFSIMSASRQKTLEEKARNMRVTRKSLTVNPKEAQKTPKSHLSSFSNCSTKGKSKKALNKQPQLSKENLVTVESSDEKMFEDQIYTIQALFNPIYALFGPKDLYTNSSYGQEVQDQTQNAALYGVLPRECFYSSETQKRRSYIDNRIHHLERKLHQQRDIISHQDQQIHNLLHQKSGIVNALEGQQVSQLSLNSQLKPWAVSSKPLRLSSIQQENQSGQNGGNADDQKNEQNLKQQIKGLNLKTSENLLLLENQSKCTISKLNNSNPELKDSESNVFYRSKLSPLEQKKLVMTSRLRQMENQIQIEQSHLKRAQITNYLDKEYFNSIKGIYWALINQKQNANLVKRSPINSQKQTQNTESFKYIKEFHKSRSQLLEESLEEDGIKYKNQERVFVDKEFLHETIQLGEINQEIHWLYFKPCPQSSIFPAELKIPQHYITTQNQSASIHALVSLLNLILNLNPKFIERLFQPTYNNVFSCWLSKDGQFEPIYVDGYLPYNGKLNSFLAWSEEFLWIGVLFKCCAKLLGGYDKLLRLNFSDWSQLILGKTISKLPKPSYKEIKEWNQEQFDQKVIQYLSKYQQKHKSTIIVRQKPTQNLYMITGIKNNKIKLSLIHSQVKRLEVSLFEFIIDEHYELILFPESPNLYSRTSKYSNFEKGNIVTYQVKIDENKSSLTIFTQLAAQEQANLQSELTKNKKQSHQRRRILVYEIPYHNKRQKKAKSEMILKYSSDNHPYTRIATNYEGMLTLQMDIPDIKKGEYKIFIQCGKIKLNDYFESHSKTLTKELQTDDEIKERVSPRGQPSENKNSQNRKFRNVFTVLSSHTIWLKGGRSLIINQQSNENEILQDEHFVYKQCKDQKKKVDSDYI